MNEREVKDLIEFACALLYADDKDLIAMHAHERTIAARLAGYLGELFEDFDVDADYNREGRERGPKRDELGRLVPDIIIHKRGERLGQNLAAIEVKGHWNREDRRIDEEQLRRLGAEYGYRYLFRLELGTDEARLIAVEPARDRALAK